MIGLLYDVHGNLPALEAVLDDATRQGVTQFVLGGDYALFGAWPAETIDRLWQLDAAARVRGNGERWTASPDEAPDAVRDAIDACAAALGQPLVAELAALPGHATIGEALACHASPSSDVRSFFPEPAPDEHELLTGIEAQRLFFGHTHLAFARQSERGIELINPGSVGMPFDGDHRAAYATLDPDGRVERRRVAYDHHASARALRERYPAAWASAVAARIDQARFDA